MNKKLEQKLKEINKELEQELFDEACETIFHDDVDEIGEYIHRRKKELLNEYILDGYGDL